MNQKEGCLDELLEEVLRSPCCGVCFDTVAQGRLCKGCAALYILNDGILVLLRQAALSGSLKRSENSD